MARLRSGARELALAGCATLIAVAYGVEMVGKTLRLVHVLTIVPLSMAAGIALSRAVASLRAIREPKGPAD
jgi:hypothetical protein